MNTNVFIQFNNGKAREAISFYRSTFGVEETPLMTFSAMPEYPEGMGDYILHSETLLGNTKLMISDSMEENIIGTNMSISVEFETVEEATKKFNLLAEGGKITTALTPTFFSETYGELTDKFGTQWLVLSKSKEM